MAAAAVQGRKPHPTDRYQRLERVGKGSFGEVFRGIDKQTQQEVAIKVLDLKRAAGDIEDIQKEISILSQCHDKHITRYYGSFKVGHKLWIVMEFLAGGSAQDLVRRGLVHSRRRCVRTLLLLAERSAVALVALIYNRSNQRPWRRVCVLLSSRACYRRCSTSITKTNSIATSSV